MESQEAEGKGALREREEKMEKNVDVEERNCTRMEGEREDETKINVRCVPDEEGIK